MTKVLVVDDDENLRDGLKRGLHGAAPGWDVTFARDGEAALSELTRQSYDVLVTDVDMPRMNGADLLSEVAKRAPNVMRVVISGRYDSLTTYSMTSCSHMFLAKPFRISRMIDMIDSALVVHRFELRRAKIWLDDIENNAGKVDVSQLAGDVRRRINRERLRRLGVHMEG